MSHWQGVWRRKDHQEVEKKPQRTVMHFDPESEIIGKTDEELLRIYYFRKP